MRILGVIVFLAGLLLGVRVMFFGVRSGTDDRFHHRRWPLALAAFLVALGAFVYLRVSRSGALTFGWTAAAVAAALVAGAGAWWVVQRSAAIPSTDPEDDPRYRFQGHIARVTEAIGRGDSQSGRIVFDFDDKRYDFRARWSTSSDTATMPEGSGLAGSEVVVETVDGDVAYVEPWIVVEQRL